MRPSARAWAAGSPQPAAPGEAGVAQLARGASASDADSRLPCPGRTRRPGSRTSTWRRSFCGSRQQHWPEMPQGIGEHRSASAPTAPPVLPPPAARSGLNLSFPPWLLCPQVRGLSAATPIYTPGQDCKQACSQSSRYEPPIPAHHGGGWVGDRGALELCPTPNMAWGTPILVLSFPI